MTGSRLTEALAAPVYVRGANRPFGELTLEDVRSRADELREATGWGPTARVAPVARAWRELALTMERGGAGAVAEVDPETLGGLVPQLWVLLPS